MTFAKWCYVPIILKRIAMKKRLNIQQKIQIYILSSVAIIFILSIGYIGIQSRERILDVSQDLANSYAREYANLTSDKLNEYAHTALNLQTIFEQYELIPHADRRDVLQGYLKSTLEANPNFLSVWSILEPNAIDTLADQHKNTVGSTILGNFRYVYYKQDNEIVLSRYVEQNPGEVLSGTIYTTTKNAMKPIIVNPYYYSYSGNKSDEILETNMVVPIIKEGKFLGVIGIDVPLNTISEMMNSYEPIEESFAFLVSHKGDLISFPNDNAIGKNINKIGFLEGDTVSFAKNMNRGLPFHYKTNYKDQQYFVASAPVTVAGTDIVWYVNIALPESIIMSLAGKTVNNAILVGLFGLLLLALVIALMARSISRPIKQLTHVINQIAEGSVDKNLKLDLQSYDEIGQMSMALNKYIDGYSEKTDFAAKIGNGELDAKFELLSEEDKLGQSLVQMQQNLAEAKNEEAARREEDKKHRWINEGVAMFADVLRQNNDNIKKLSFELMRKLVDYMRVHQGAIFVIDEGDSQEKDIYFETTCTIAFDRRQYTKNRIKMGEDLVGRCAHERKKIYLREVPENYINITSGMGEARPQVILIVPAILNDKVYAVIELASFHEIDEYQINFMEKISESIASTIANVKVSERTQILLKESQHQREELSSQEEEMRQNLEELQTTQEEAARREFELRNLIEALSISNYMVEYDMNGIITDANDRFVSLVGISREQIIGMNHNDGLNLSGLSAQKYQQFWEDLRHGINRTEESNIEYNGRSLHMLETYTPLLDEDGKAYKVVKIAIDVTKQKEFQAKYEQTLSELTDKEEETKTLQDKLLNINKELDEKALQLSKMEQQLKQHTAAPQPVTKTSDTPVEVPLPAAGEPLIHWTEAMDNAIEEMDEQHRKIVQMVDQLYIGLRTDKPKKEIKELLKMLVDYTAWHFSSEERYFQEFEFANATAHKKEHDAFMAHIDSFRKKYQAGKIKFYDDVMRYNKTWIEEHFATADKQYEELFMKNGLK
jgi:methyl-accepting chemotaxis protein